MLPVFFFFTGGKSPATQHTLRKMYYVVLTIFCMFVTPSNPYK